MTKPTTRPVWPAKTHIRLYSHLIWHGISFVPEIVEGTCDQRRLWSDCADAQAVLSRCSSHVLLQVLLCARSFYVTWPVPYSLQHLSRGTAFPTKLHVRPAKTLISLRMRAVWSESSLSACRRFGSLASHRVFCEDSNQTTRTSRWIWVLT